MAELPPLPEMSFLGDDVSYGYDAIDMRDYANEAIAQATQRIAELEQQLESERAERGALQALHADACAKAHALEQQLAQERRATLALRAALRERCIGGYREGTIGYRAGAVEAEILLEAIAQIGAGMEGSK